VRAANPDLVLCPFLREGSRNGVADPPTIVIHPGPKGDAGPIWPSRNFPRPGGPAAQLILEVITKAADPDFRPEPGD